MEELSSLLLHEIVRVYGPLQGQGIGAIVIPAFIGDFKKVLDGSESYDEISEEYMTEDKRIHLVLTGRKTLGQKGMKYTITDCEFNGTSINCEHAMY